MAWNLLDNLTSSTNPQENLVNIANVGNNNIPNFWALLIILPLFVILSLRGFFIKKERDIKTSIWPSFASSAFVCMVVALFMNLMGILSSTLFSWIVGIGLIFVVVFILIDQNK